MENLTQKVGNYRWWIVVLLFFATTINYIDRQVISILKPFISDDLGWSEMDYGFIVTSFQIAYAAGLILTGPFLDKLGTKAGYIWAMIIWSIAGIAHAAARGVSSFAIVRFVLGLGESANFPAAVKSVSEWFPKKERAFATGLFNSGATIGAIIAPIIVSAITLSMGWRSAFIITGALGFFWIIVWVIFYHHPAKHPNLSKQELDYINQDDAATGQTRKISWLQLFRYKQTAALCSTRFISDWVWWFFLFWTPDYLAKSQGINIKELVLPLIIIYGVSSVGGIGGGWVSSQFIKRGKTVDYARKTTIFLSALLALPIILIPWTNGLWAAVVLIALGTSGHQSWASNMFTIISDIFPKSKVGSMVGLSGFVGAVGGALSASFVGIVLETTHSYSLIFVIASLVYLLNWIIIKVFIPRIEPIRE